MESRKKYSPWRKKLHEVIFEADTTAGKIFDIVLLILILASVIVIFLETVPDLNAKYGWFYEIFDLFITIIFTIEYILRIISARRPMKYITSFYGVIDLLALLPTYVGLFFPEIRFLLVIRILRLLRIFRVFGLIHFFKESLHLLNSLWKSRRKILVFFLAVILITVIAGALMYMVEHTKNPSFKSIPESIYWAIVTITTVGYGDISPVTPVGKFIASFIMLLGYCIIAVPTGIVSAEIVKDMRKHEGNTQTCPNCFKEGHDRNATFCKYCGSHL